MWNTTVKGRWAIVANRNAFVRWWALFVILGGLAPALTFAQAETNGNRAVGLWVGDVTLNKVSHPESANPDLPVTASGGTNGGFRFRILVHVDTNGTARLLQRALLRWQNGTYKPANDGSTNRVVDQPGRYVLVANEKRATNFAGAAVRDSQAVGRRISTTAFGFSTPIVMTGSGSFGAANSAYTATVEIPYDDRMNPFVHLYHPDHDNLSPLNDSQGNPMRLPEMEDARGKFTTESYTVRREVRLEFMGEDPENLAVAGFGDLRLGGIYRERVVGLHKNTIHLAGTFQIYRATPVGTLEQ